jgi:hypothetical protein
MLLCLLLTLVFSQDPPHGSTHDRGATVMGVDQNATAHHFYLFDNGGAIDIRVKDAGNTKDRDAIRSHLPHIAMMFGHGEFDAPMLVHDTKNVPGVAVLAERRDAIAYRYADTPAGGRVDIVTTDPAALAALHDFLRYQIREHKTGDAPKVTPRR